MGRFTFTLLLCAATGCADRAVVDDGSTLPDEPEIMGTGMDGVGPTASRLALDACGETRVTTTRIARSLAITQASPARELMFGTRDGQLLGYHIFAGELVSDPDGVRLDDQKVKTVTATQLGGHTVLASTDGDSIFVDLVSDQMRLVHRIATLPGTATSEIPMVTAPDGYVLPTLDTDGIHIDHFNVDWRLDRSMVVTTTQPPDGIAAAPFGNNSMIAWSANGQCHLQFASTGRDGDGSIVDHPCASPHLAVDPTTGEALVAYQTPAGVMINRAPFQRLGTPHLLRAAATEPQVMFDGTRFWVSYVDEGAKLTIGFFDDQAHFVSAAVPQMNPEHGNYRLQMLEGLAAIVSTDSDGYSVQSMCTRTL
jgi:hypothetical protein